MVNKMVQVHKYVDYAVTAGLIAGLQCAFASTRGIHYYAIGVGISYFSVKPVVEFLAESINASMEPGLLKALVVNNIKYTVGSAARGCFSDYMLRPSINAYMGSLGYGENMTRVLTHSAIVLASSAQCPTDYNKEGRTILSHSKLGLAIYSAARVGAEYYFEPKVGNLPKIFFLSFLTQFAYACGVTYETWDNKSKSSLGEVAQSILADCAWSSANRVASIGIVSGINLDIESVSGKIATVTLSNSIATVASDLIKGLTANSK